MAAGRPPLTRRAWRGLMFLLLLLSGSAGAAGFQRGVNLSRWFEASAGAPVESRELRRLRDAGFDHVRIPVDPVALGWQPARGPRLTGTARLRAAIDTALAAGLDVIVDMHPSQDTKQSIESDAAWADGYVAMWEQLASEFKPLPPQRVAFELFNEPGYYGLTGPFVWSRYQRRLVKTVRGVLPRHTLIVSGRKGGSLEGLTELARLDDDNLIYSFHYYLPYIFTHQGASWMQGDQWTTAGHWHRVRYPSALARAQLPRTDGTVAVGRARDELTEYFQAGWDREEIAKQWQPLRDWARVNRVRVHCGEFGVIRNGVDAQSRYRWIGDVRWLVEANGWGWSVWNYADDFGITANSNTDGSARGELEPAALQALGLDKAAR